MDDDTLIFFTFSGVVNDASLDAEIPYEGSVTIPLAAPREMLDPVTNEAVFLVDDPGAVFLLDGTPLDITSFELRVGNNLDVGGQGIFVVDALVLEARSLEAGNTYTVSVGVASADTGVIRGFRVPEGPYTDEDFDGSFMSSLFLPALSGEILRAETTDFGWYPTGPGVETGAGLAAEDAQFVAYLYEAGLDRDGDIDLPGLNFWIDAAEGGLTRRDLANAFIGSAEFEAGFGDPEMLTEDDLVTLLYENVLDREADEAGLAFWRGIAAEPGVDAAALLIAFARSAENAAGSPEVATLSEVAPGYWDFG